MKIHNEQEYRDAIAELQRLTDNPAPGRGAEKRRQTLIAAIETWAQKDTPDKRMAKPERSIPTR